MLSNAVEQVVIEDAAEAVDVEGTFPLGVICAELGGAGNDARGQFDQLRILASVQWQFGDLALIDDLPALAGFCFQLGGFGRGDYRSGCRGHTQLHIHALVCADCEVEAGRGGLKALRGDVQFIGADRDRQKAKLSAVVGAGRGACLRGCIVQHHLAVRDDCPAGVGHCSEYGGCVELRPGDCCQYHE